MARTHITTLRKLRKLSQTALANAVGLTGAEISRIECGYRDLSETEAVAIAKALDVVPGKIDERLLKPIAPVGIAASGSTGVESKPSQTSASLEDNPANFREMPDTALLERGDVNETVYRSRLTEALKRTQRILHTPRVPAATWRAWREFERMGQERLRG